MPPADVAAPPASPTPRAGILARSSLPRFGQDAKGVHVFVTGPAMLTNSTYGPFVPGSRDDGRIQVPGPGLKLIDRTPHFLAYAHC